MTVFSFSNIIEAEAEAESKLLLISIIQKKKSSEDIFYSKLVSGISATDATITKKFKMRKTWLAEQQVSDNTLKNKINITALHDNAANQSKNHKRKSTSMQLVARKQLINCMKKRIKSLNKMTVNDLKKASKRVKIKKFI